MTNEQTSGKLPANKCIPLGPARHRPNNLIIEELLDDFYAMTTNLLTAINSREPGRQYATAQEVDVLYKLSRCIATLKKDQKPRSAKSTIHHRNSVMKSFNAPRY
jgi:hypothetical protein